MQGGGVTTTSNDALRRFSAFLSCCPGHSIDGYFSCSFVAAPARLVLSEPGIVAHHFAAHRVHHSCGRLVSEDALEM